MPGKKKTTALGWIYEVSGPARKWVLALTLVRIFQGVLAIAYAYALRAVVNCAAAGEQGAFLDNLWQFVGLVLATVILQALGRYLTEKAHGALDKAFRMQAFSQLLSRDYAQVSKVHTGDWMNRILSDTQAISAAVIRIVPELCGMLVRLAGAVLALVGIIPLVAALALPAGGIMILISYFLRKRMKHHHAQVQQAEGDIHSFLQERLASLTVIHTFTQEEAAAGQAQKKMDTWVSKRMKRSRFANFSSTALTFAMISVQTIGIAVCCWGILHGTVTYGTMSATLYLINLLSAPFSQLSGALSQYYGMLSSAERLMEIEKLEPDGTEKPLPREEVLSFYEKEFAALELEDVRFHYEKDGDEVLENVSLTLNKGEFWAFTGPSGCGKSTAMKLLLSLYPLSGGDAWVHTEAGEKLPLDSRWRGLFAYVPQGNLLLSGTIRESLAFFDKALMAQDEKIHQALAVACAEEFVKELPLGIDTPLGEGGSGLSEGQMQRLSIARAVLSQRPILLLDEATSALDAKTEQQLLTNLRAMTDRTVVIITHRETVAGCCDGIVSFETDTL